jgi:hypothetical protein
VTTISSNIAALTAPALADIAKANSDFLKTAFIFPPWEFVLPTLTKGYLLFFIPLKLLALTLTLTLVLALALALALLAAGTKKI